MEVQKKQAKVCDAVNNHTNMSDKVPVKFLALD